MLSDSQLAAIDRATVGVLGLTTRAGLPNAVAVTPYVVGDSIVVTSTLALVDKAEALRADSRVTLSAGRVAVAGTATVEVDPTPRYFDRFIRAQELAKFPPARSLLAFPFHRRLLPWYVGRVIITIQVAEAVDQACDDGTTVTTIDVDGRLRTSNVPLPAGLTADSVELPAGVPDGPALLLVHQEDPAMRDLRQHGLRGTVRDQVLHVSSRRGSLTPRRSSVWGELQSLRTLAHAAQQHRALVGAWPTYEPTASG